MSNPISTLFEGDSLLDDSTPIKKGHRSSRWRKRFFILIGVTILSNLLLLFALAYSRYTLDQADALTKSDLHTVLRLLPGTLARKDLLAAIKRTAPESRIEESEKHIAVGGLTFHFDDKQQLQRVEHWTVEAR